MTAHPFAFVNWICDPVPLMFYVWGPSLSLTFFINSLLALLVIVTVKSILFACFARIGAVRGFLSMAAANVFSGIAGFLLAVTLGSGTGLGLIALLVLMAIGGGIGKKCCQGFQGTRWERLTPGLFVGATVILAFASLLAGFLLTNVDPRDHLITYWLVKIVGATLGIAGSLAFSILWEGALVCAINRKADVHHLMKATVAANLWVFFIFFLIGAAIALPQRLRHPGGMLPP